LEQTNQLERINKTVLNLTNNPNKPKGNINTQTQSRKTSNVNNNNKQISIENSKGFSLEPKENSIKNPLEKNEKLTHREKFILKRLKKMEISYPINLFYQMHPEKNEKGFYSFNNTNENYSNSAFTLNKQINKNKNKQFAVCNQVNESYNANVKNNAKKNIENIVMTNTNNIEIGPDPGNHLKQKNSKDYSKNKISFNNPKGKEGNNKNNDNNNNDDIFIDINDTFEVNNNNNNNNNSENEEFIVDEKISFVENIKKNIGDIDFFDKIKKTLDHKRINDSLKTYEILGIRNGDLEKINQGQQKKSKISAYCSNNNNKVEKGDLNELNNLNTISENNNNNNNNNNIEDNILVFPTNKNKNNLQIASNINTNTGTNKIKKIKLKYLIIFI